MNSALDILPAVDLGMELMEDTNCEQAAQGPRATIIKVRPIYEVSRSGCQCLGFVQYKLDGFDSASYMDMLSDPQTMQAIKEIYYQPKETSDELVIIDNQELPLEY